MAFRRSAVPAAVLLGFTVALMPGLLGSWAPGPLRSQPQHAVLHGGHRQSFLACRRLGSWIPGLREGRLRTSPRRGPGGLSGGLDARRSSPRLSGWMPGFLDFGAGRLETSPRRPMAGSQRVVIACPRFEG